MAANCDVICPSVDAGGKPADEIRYLSRQPILDVKGNVHAYALLYGGAVGSVSGCEREARALLDSAILLGLERLTGGLPAFVRCTPAMLTASLVEILPAGTTVLEIPCDLALDPELIEACRRLKSEGFRLALDNFAWQPGIDPLVEIASYIKIDFASTSVLDRAPLLERLGNAALARVAQNVESQDQYDLARQERFTLMQGYHFCRPALLKNRQIPANRLSQVEILRLLQDENLNLQKLTQLVKRDASLTYRLLRFINSPACAMKQEIYSVQTALLVVGEDAFRRMASLAITGELNAGQPPELLRMAFVRGRFCELAAITYGLDCTEQYLLGLMSLVSAMLRQPMKDLTPLLPLRGEIRLALEGERVPERILLAWIERYELGDWPACDAIVAENRLDATVLRGCYEEAVQWAEAALHRE
ncbi:MAG: HDOD domain-containing protein [Terracidiphilus sp.]